MVAGEIDSADPVCVWEAFMIDRRFAVPAILLVGALGLAGCAGPATRASDAVPAVTASSSPVEESASGRETATIEAFVKAAHDVDNDYDAALAHTSPGSLAERYLMHLKASHTALKANGDYYDDGVQPSLSVDDGVASVTYPDGQSYEWSDFEFDDNGLISTFSNPGGSLDDVLWDGQPWSAQGGGATVERVSAYRSSSGLLTVVLKVTAADNPVSVYSFNATYAASDGIQYTSSMDGSEPSADIQVGSAGYVVVTFPEAPFGGVLRLEVTNPITYDRAVVEVPIA